MLSAKHAKILSSFLLLIYPLVEFIVAIEYRQDILFNTNYSLNISNWLIVKDIFSMFTIGILTFYYITERISMFTYCISQGFVYFSMFFTFIWTCIGLFIYANQFVLDDFDTPIVFIGVFGGYLCIYNLYKLNILVNEYIEDIKRKPLIDM